MFVHRVRTLEEFFEYCNRSELARDKCREFEAAVVPRWPRPFWVRGWSYPARKQVFFRVGYKYAHAGQVNWREQLRCPITKLNNRMRAAIHLFDVECSPYWDDKIYISEQVTPLYGVVRSRYNNVTGSEYLGAEVTSGKEDKRGVRNEDLTQLSFTNASYDHVLSFDCLEHVPDYKKTIDEIYRVLKTPGNFVLSVPFDSRSENNLQRARLSADGTIEHLLPPEYHGDPLCRNGCLSYWVFGWELLDKMRATGFSDVYAVYYWSKAFGYLGENQVLFIAKK